MVGGQQGLESAGAEVDHAAEFRVGRTGAVLPSMVVVALGEPGVPVVWTCALAEGAATITIPRASRSEGRGTSISSLLLFDPAEIPFAPGRDCWWVSSGGFYVSLFQRDRLCRQPGASMRPWSHRPQESSAEARAQEDEQGRAAARPNRSVATREPGLRPARIWLPGAMTRSDSPRAAPSPPPAEDFRDGQHDFVPSLLQRQVDRSLPEPDQALLPRVVVAVVGVAREDRPAVQEDRDLVAVSEAELADGADAESTATRARTAGRSDALRASASRTLRRTTRPDGSAATFCHPAATASGAHLAGARA